MGIVRGYTLDELDYQLDATDKSTKNLFMGKVLARYAGLSSAVKAITCAISTVMSSVRSDFEKSFFLNTQNATFWISLTQVDSEKRQIPRRYQFDKRSIAYPKYILDYGKYLNLEETHVSEHEFHCNGFYETCESFSGRKGDPLNCFWCVDSNSIAGEYDECNVKLERICPPSVSNVLPSENNTQWFIEGSHLDTFENVVVSICDEPCNITKQTNSRISCNTTFGSIIKESCEVILNGTLEDQDYTVTTNTNKLEFAIEQSKIVKLVAIVVTLAVIFIVILLIYITISDEKDYMPVPAIEMQLQNKYQRLFESMDAKIKIPLSNLQMDNLIGEGQFGYVYRGTYNRKNSEELIVACKKIKKSGAQELILEGQTMQRFNHRRVVKFIGMALDEKFMPIIVTEFMFHGDMRKYLEGYGKFKTKADLLKFAVQIAEGMEYLHAKHFIHRDLAARNCMLDEHLQVKIADFGLARECNNENIYTPNVMRYLPVAWMSIESFEQGAVFSFKSDVWSYGIVLWEIFSNGETPYGERKGMQICYFVKDGNRLEKPHGCPEQLYAEVMLPCWSVEMNNRKNFSELLPLVTTIWASISFKKKTLITNGL